MNLMRLFTFTYLLTISLSFAFDCRENLDYQRNLTKHENEIRDLKLKLREDMIDKCPRSKLATSYCKNRLEKFKNLIEIKDAEFLRVPINQQCATKNKDIVQSTREYYQETNQQGYFVAGVYREQHQCMESQQANQTCRDVNKVLEKCEVKGRHLYVKCAERTQYNSSNICYEASPILTLLTSEYSVCQVSVKDLEKFAPCLAQSAKDNRQRLCPRGCASMPTKKMCDWEEDEIDNYLGCLQIATKEQYKKLCPNRAVVKVEEAKVASPVKNCPPTRHAGRVNPWKLQLNNEFPQTMEAGRFVKTSAKPREYLSIAFNVNEKDFIKKLSKGDDFAEPGESTKQNAKGSGTFYLLAAPGYSGHKQMSVTTCPGLFEEDGVDSACLAKSDKHAKMFWEVNGEGQDTCQLKPGKRYFLNIRFSRGCNWKNNCGVKIKQVKN